MRYARYPSAAHALQPSTAMPASRPTTWNSLLASLLAILASMSMGRSAICSVRWALSLFPPLIPAKPASVLASRVRIQPLA
jgi:hypothetical protein